MSKMIKTTLVAMAILAGASAGYAANGNGASSGGGFGQDGGRSDEQMQMKRDEMIDRNPTGSIVTCDSGAYDANGNCIMNPDMQ